jgi:hypothetical protein
LIPLAPKELNQLIAHSGLLLRIHGKSVRAGKADSPWAVLWNG